MQSLTVSTRLDAATHNVLKVMAKKEERTLSYLFRKAIEEYVGRGRKARRRAFAPKQKAHSV